MATKCVAIDDEPLALEIIKKFCDRVGDVDLKVFTDAEEGLEYICEVRTDVAFLDIEMGHLSGIQLARRLPETTCIVFTTAYMQYAVEGFNLDAADYLHKPFSYERFKEAMGKARRRMEYIRQKFYADTILVKMEYNNVPVTLNHILYIEAMENYSKIYMDDGKMILAHNSLKSLTEQLPEGSFYRIHKSYVVHKDSIRSFTRQNVTLHSGKELPVGRQFSGVLTEVFKPS